MRTAVRFVDGVDPLRRAVRERFRRGAHAIKIMASGGVMSLAEGATADLLILGGNICDDPSVVWSPGSQRTIVQNGRVTPAGIC
jgi:hypothetical protein